MSSKTIFSEGIVDETEISEETIFMIKEKLFENQNSKQLKKFNNSSKEFTFFDTQALKQLIEKIYKDKPIIHNSEEFSKKLLENCLIVRNISNHVDEEMLFYLFSQGSF